MQSAVQFELRLLHSVVPDLLAAVLCLPDSLSPSLCLCFSFPLPLSLSLFLSPSSFSPRGASLSLRELLPQLHARNRRHTSTALSFVRSRGRYMYIYNHTFYRVHGQNRNTKAESVSNYTCARALHVRVHRVECLLIQRAKSKRRQMLAV